MKNVSKNQWVAIFMAGLSLAANTASACCGPEDDAKIIFNGSGLQAFDQIGNANWTLEKGAVRADSGSGFLVTKATYQDFYLKADFYAEKGTNSGVFFRCADPKNVTDENCFEANLFDTRPDQTYRTGALTRLAQPKAIVNTEGKWNTIEVYANDYLILVTINGVTTAEYDDSARNRARAGRIAFQFAGGGVRFGTIKIANLTSDAVSITSPKDSLPLYGVWDLTRFELDDGKGSVTPWCEGAFGVIIYTAEYMSVAINCTSDPQKMLHYSGPYQFDGESVTHHVRNFSDPALNRDLVRKVVRPDDDRLDLEGPFGQGGKAVISWKRR